MTRHAASSILLAVTAALLTPSPVRTQPLVYTSASFVHREMVPERNHDGDRSAAHGGGTTIVVWEQNYREPDGDTDSTAEVLAARSTDGGRTWAPSVQLTDTLPGQRFRNSSPGVATDGAGHWVAAWFSNDDHGLTLPSLDDVVVVRSADDGVTWTVPAPLSTNAGGTAISLNLPAVALATDGAGTWLATWSSAHDLPGGNDDDVVVARSSDNGATWTPAAPIDAQAATDATQERRSQIVTDGGGTWLAVWHSISSVGTGAHVLAARSLDAGTTWSAPTTLSAPTLSYDPVVTMSPSGTTIVAWEARGNVGLGTDSDVIYVRSIDAGATWSPFAPFDPTAATDTAHHVRPNVVTNGTGTWIATWNTSLQARSTDDGVTWAPQPNNFHPTLSIGPATWLRVTTASSTSFGFLGLPRRLGPELGTHVSAVPGAMCGDGALGPGETCEDGNVADGDGCSARCRIEPCFACSGLPATCVEAPRTGCKQQVIAGRGKLEIRDMTPDTGDKLVWQWFFGDETTIDELGDPFTSHDYALCIYDGSAPPARLVLPAGEVCIPNPSLAGPGTYCWKQSGVPIRTVSYSDRFRTPDGVDRLNVNLGEAGRAKILLKAKGVDMPDGLLPLGLPARLQLQSAAGTCWETVFSTAVQNDATTFKALSD